MKVIGLDLAGVESRPTGFCLLDNLMAEPSLVYADADILLKTTQANPRVVAIDAPLSLPKGRKSIEDRTDVHLRECDIELAKHGIKFFPITLGPMRKLTERGMKLKAKLELKGFSTIEVYPGGAQDVLRIPRRQHGIHSLRKGLESLGINGLTDGLSDHELDAVTCAYVGKLFLDGGACVYGTQEQAIIMPYG